jgi:hypothetical protein
MDKFLDTYYLSKLNQEDTNNMSRSIASYEIGMVIKNLLTKKSP